MFWKTLIAVVLAVATYVLTRNTGGTVAVFVIAMI
jgi:hypothetical protein